MSPDFDVGSVFAGYRIDGSAGRGGMGVVYVATDVRLKRRVALKVITPELSRDPEFRQRFERESEIAASLRHPNVVTIFTAGEEQGQLFVTMDYVEGTDLREMIMTRGRLRPDLAAHLVGQVAAALDAAHSRGLVHRDIKPANVLISEDGAAPEAYLTDFGLSKLASNVAGLTRTGVILGTMDYIAPEQLQGAPVDARTDVYALGCVLYEVLTGSVPYPRDTDAARMWAHITEPPPRVRALAPDVPAEFEAVLQRAMAKEPGQRYPSAGDFGGAARQAAYGRASSVAERSVATGAAARGVAPAGPATHHAITAPADPGRTYVPPGGPGPRVASPGAGPPGTGPRREWSGGAGPTGGGARKSRAPLVAALVGAGLLMVAAVAAVVVLAGGGKGDTGTQARDRARRLAGNPAGAVVGAVLVRPYAELKVGPGADQGR